MAPVRGTQIKQSIPALAWLGLEARAEVLRVISPDTLKQIQDAVQVQWLPQSLPVDLCRCVRVVSSEEAVRTWARASVRGALKGPLYGPFVKG